MHQPREIVTGPTKGALQGSYSYQHQLPIYQRAENTSRGIYLMIHNGGSETRLDRLLVEAAAAGDVGPKVIVVNGIPRPSANKATD